MERYMRYEDFAPLKAEHEQVKAERKKRCRNEQHRRAEEDAADRLRTEEQKVERQWVDRLQEARKKEEMIKAQTQKTKMERLPKVRSGGPSVTPTDVLGSETEQQESKRLRVRFAPPWY